MQVFGLFSLLFGILVVAYPKFLAYLVGGFFMFIGLSILMTSYMMRPRGTIKPSWNIGGYEIVKRK